MRVVRAFAAFILARVLSFESPNINFITIVVSRESRPELYFINLLKAWCGFSMRGFLLIVY
jgi:hypothetical protein